MFILQGRDYYGEYQYVIGYSQDKDKLQAMIDQYKAATCSTNGALVHIEQCPAEFNFGKFSLKKSFDAYGYSCEGLCIYHTDFLSIQEAEEL